MNWKLNGKVEDLMHLDAETKIRDHREIFMFLLGEHAKRVTKLEVVAGAAQRYLDGLRGRGASKQLPPGLERLINALSDFKKVDERLRPRKKKGAKKA